jgi:hypothetical protein
VRKYISLPGFRNSAWPLPLRVKGAVTALAATRISLPRSFRVRIETDLRQKVHEMLKTRIG